MSIVYVEINDKFQESNLHRRGLKVMAFHKRVERQAVSTMNFDSVNLSKEVKD